MPTIPRIISVDDHVVEPAHLFERWLPKRYRADGPRVVRSGTKPVYFVDGRFVLEEDPQGRPTDFWLYGDVRMPLRAAEAAVGLPVMDNGGITFDGMRPGLYDPVERVKDMDLNGVEASLCFPNSIPRFCGQTFLEGKDKDLGAACVRAYNDWMVEEWSGDSGGRLIPLCMVPLWSATLAAEEVERNAARGVHAITFPENPASLGLPSIHSSDRYWEPLFAACADTRTTVCMHIGSSSKLPTTSPDAPAAVTAVLLNLNAMSSMVDWLFSGIFERFPEIVVAYSEGNIGWIPFILERSDRIWEEHKFLYTEQSLPRKPIEYYADHIYGCYISDSHGLRSVDLVGEDNITYETDYPHTDGTWPNSRDVAERELGHLTESQIEKIVRGNAIRMLSLDLPAVTRLGTPQSEAADVR
jgi:predicted TIM-barrel fold metal-dependent hydrolase